MLSPAELQGELRLSLTAAEEEKEQKEKEEVGAASEPMAVVSRRKPHSVILHSPFFHVLSELIEENAESVQALRITSITKKNGKKAFLIHLDSPPARPLFAKYRFEERHFSIDETYKTSKKKQHGFTPFHYTETYVSEAAEESITVHVYLNKQSQYLYSQVKKRSGDPAEITNLEVEAQQIELLKINANSSMEILLPLLTERQERYLKLKKEADNLQEALVKLSQDLQNHSALENYKKIAKEFIAVIKRLNQYTELRDLRDRTVLTTLESLTEWSEKIQKALQEARSVSASDDLPSVEAHASEETSPEADSKKSSELEILSLSLTAELEALCEQLNIKIIYSLENLKKIQERHEIFKQANIKLMALFEFPDDFLQHSSRKKKINSLIKKGSLLTRQYVQQGSALLQQEALKGNVAAVKGLFALFGHKLDEAFYKEMLNSLMTERLPQKKENLMEVCDFFSTCSEPYRTAVLMVSRQAKYLIENSELRNLFPILDIRHAYNASVLFRAYCSNDLPVFKMLLQHGADPNSAGAFVPENPEESMSIFTLIAGYRTPHCADYLRQLIQFGANPNNTTTLSQQRSFLRKKSSSIKSLSRGGRNHRKPSGILQLNITSLMLEPAFIIIMYSDDLNLFIDLLPYLSVDTLAYAFATIATDEDIRCLQFLAGSKSAAMVKFVKDQKIAHESSSVELDKTGSFLNVIFYEDSAYKEFFKDQSQKFQMIYETLYRKLKGVDVKKFDEIYQILFKKGIEKALLSKKEATKTEIIKPYNCFFGCMFLLITRASILNFDNQAINMLKQYHHDWFKQITSTFPIRYPQKTHPGHAEFIEQLYATWGENITLAFKQAKKASPIPPPAASLSASESTPALLFSRSEKLKKCPPKKNSSSSSSSSLSSSSSSSSSSPSSSQALLLRSPSIPPAAEPVPHQIKLLLRSEFSITTPESNTPILETLNVFPGYAIMIFHKNRTCLIHMDDNNSYQHLEFIVNKFLNKSDQELKIIHEYLALSPHDCTVTLAGGWNDHKSSRELGMALKDYFTKEGFLLTLTNFQVKNSKEKHKQRELVGGGFASINIDSRDGHIIFSENWSLALSKESVLPFKEERTSAMLYLHSIHLQQKDLRWSGVRFISPDDDLLVSKEHQAVQLCNIAKQGDYKKLKEFLETMTIDINVSPNHAKGCTALHYACVAKPFTLQHRDCAKLLISHGADITLKNHQGRDALYLIKNDQEIVEELQLRWSVRKAGIQRMGNPASLTFALYHRHPEQLEERERRSMRAIEAGFATPEGRHDVCKMFGFGLTN